MIKKILIIIITGSIIFNFLPAITLGAAITRDVSITSGGVFSPSTIIIEAGDTVKWINNDNTIHDIESNDHPTHLKYPLLNLGPISPGASLTLQFNVKSSDSGYGYHDHTNSDIEGAVIVQAAGTAPTLSSITVTSIAENNATINWDTSEQATSQVEYGKTSSYGSTTTLNSTFIDSHSQKISNLESDTAYHYRVKSKDPNGNLSVSTDRSFTTSKPKDTEAPKITSVLVVNIKDTSAKITWKTNENATSKVEYGKTISYGLSETSTSLVNDHAISLKNLEPETNYHFRINSKDEADNEAKSSDKNFTTLSEEAAGDSTPPSQPLNLIATPMSSTKITLTWDISTDNVEISKYQIFRNNKKISDTTTTNFTDTVKVSTTYTYQVLAIDPVGNLSDKSDEAIATTPAEGEAPIVAIVTEISFSGQTFTQEQIAAGIIVPFEEPLVISGITFPKSNITFFVSSPETLTFNITSDSQGKWSYTFDTSLFSQEEHFVVVEVEVDGIVKERNPLLNFTVGEPIVQETKGGINAKYILWGILGLLILVILWYLVKNRRRKIPPRVPFAS